VTSEANKKILLLEESDLNPCKLPLLIASKSIMFWPTYQLASENLCFFNTLHLNWRKKQ